MELVLNRFVFSETNAIILFDLKDTSYKTIFLGDNQRCVNIISSWKFTNIICRGEKKGGGIQVKC